MDPTASRRHWRSLPMITVVAIAVASLAACSGGGGSSAATSSSTATSSGAATSSSDEKVTLTMWNWVDASPAIAEFEKSHPNIDVQLEMVPSGADAYAKMFAAIKAGNAPDVGLIELNTLPQFIGTGGLANLADYGAASIKDDFMPWAWSQVSVGDGVYALPLSSSPIAYHFNKDLLDKYGIAVPTTYAELADAAIAYHKANPSGYLVDLPPLANYMALLTWQAGGRWFAADGDQWKVGIAGPEAKTVADYLQKLLDSGAVYTEAQWETPWFQALNDGTLASFVGPQWADSLLAAQVESQAGQWRVSTAPQWVAGKQVDAQSGGGSLVVFKDSAHPAEAYEFVRWMLEDHAAQSLNYQAGYGWPTTISGSSIPELDQQLPFYGDQNPKSIYVASNDATAQDWQWGPNYSTLSTDFNDLLAKAFSGEISVWDAFTQAQDKELARLADAGINAQAAAQ